MPSKSQDDTQNSKRLPFEPSSNRKKGDKKSSPTASSLPAQSGKATSNTSKNTSNKSSEKNSEKSGQAQSPRSNPSGPSRIPEVVSRRMVKRMALFCGIPTFLGVSSFFVSYFVVTQGIELPTTAVLFVSLGFFGLGVLGLSYGALSTSWDEFKPGGWLGWSEFMLNLGRMKQAWQDARNQSSNQSN